MSDLNVGGESLAAGQPNHLSVLLVDTVLELSATRGLVQTQMEMLHVALGLLHTQGRELAEAKRRTLVLLEELRTLRHHSSSNVAA